MWLQQAGFLRRHKDPASDIVAVMFGLKLPELPCPGCQKKGVRISQQVQSIEDDDSQWDTAGSGGTTQAADKYCTDCRSVIDPDRLEFFPDTVRCGDCQRKFEGQADGRTSDQWNVDDLCPRCGDFLQTRRNRSSLNAYRVQCPGCGYTPRH